MPKKRTLPGRVICCPSCNCEIRFSWLSGMSVPQVHVYANENNDVLIRAEWWLCLKPLLDGGAPDSDVLKEVNNLLTSISPSLPAKYSVWNNIKCPQCKVEFPYRFKGNLKRRLEDQEVILIDGCTADTGSELFVVEVIVQQN